MSAPVPQRITSSGYSLITFFSLMLIVFFLTCFQIYVYSIFPMSRRPWWPFLTSLLVQSELTEEKRPREEARTSLLIYYCLFLFVWFSFNVRPGLHFLVEWVILVSGSSHKFTWVSAKVQKLNWTFSSAEIWDMKTLDILKRRSKIIQSILPSDKMLAFSFNRDLVQLKLSRASTSSSALKFSLTVVNKMIKCKNEFLVFGVWSGAPWSSLPSLTGPVSTFCLLRIIPALNSYRTPTV